MAKRNRMSVATIDSPEFINIAQMSNPLISKCEVKVMYVGANRNGSFISKEVAREMAATLPGCPIVGYFLESKEDFGDHGDQVIIDGEGIKFKKLTKPYGFVAPDAKVWFQKFEDTDEFGNKCTREYLMTEGYLWTGQYEEAKRVIEEGNPQSMELDEKSMKGYWSTDTNRGVDFFIINDAIFTKLCILGEDVEPCFEGANITAPNLSTNFTKQEDVVKTLFSMMSELKFALQNTDKGGTPMQSQIDENFSNGQGNVGEPTPVKNENTTEDFKKKPEEEEAKKAEGGEEPEAPKGGESKPEEDEDEKKKAPAKHVKKDEEEEPKKSDDNKSEEPTKDNKEDEEEDKKKKKEFSLLEEKYAELQNKFSALEANYNELLTFKKEVENTQKDEMIQSFYMLSDEDKADVVAHKAEYSLEDIKAKLSIICFEKKVDFSLGKKEEAEEQLKTPTTFKMHAGTPDEDMPAWLKAVEATRNRNK